MANHAAAAADTSLAREFVSGFCDGFGFSGLFCKLDQPELPFAEAAEEAESAARLGSAGMSDDEIVRVVNSLAEWERRMGSRSWRSKDSLMPVLEAILNAAK